jgi:membrane-associated phospholipid phosphatase
MGSVILKFFSIDRKLTSWRQYLCRISLILTVALLGFSYKMLNEATTTGNIMESSIDKLIPFNKYFVIFYLFWYIYVMGYLFYFAALDGKSYMKLLISMNAGYLISMLIFFIYPTYVLRPDVLPTDIFSKAVIGLVYGSDKPFTCLPSIHVIETSLVMIYAQEEKAVGRYLKLLTHFIGIMIILSTMFVKQHYLIDVVAGIGVAYMLYLVNKYMLSNYLTSAEEQTAAIEDIS